jgi:arsenite-transporting ATPase
MTSLHTLFFLGKGGTGKSTASALVSLVLREKGKKVLLASFDDAHNQADIFDTIMSDKACTMGPCLEVLQMDRDKEIKRYLSKTAAQVKASFAYLTAFNLDHYFDILKFSPGMEEYALVSAFTELAARYKTHDFLVIDMPPTALSLRFFNLPALSLTWTDQLETLRKQINEKKEIISRITLAGKTFERDRIMKRIVQIKSDYQKLKALFEDPAKTSFYVVYNQDALSVAETRRIIEHLNRQVIHPRGVICNDRTGAETNPSRDTLLFPGIPVQAIPYAKTPLIGMAALDRHIQSHCLTFDRILPQ